ncbi:hypothetical protein MiTs_02586 [Microcystis aeruginosa NIES-2521]|uniref:Uncharacterized protein n=2 Tax=Microcystis aeruginosa TaxID=1126 RepID=A0A5A5S5F4_MICAE|nr:hypothetical protein MiTs_02586 [Microcystis aeruginosa NIES-2521]
MVSLQSEELKESREASLDLAKPAQEEIKNHPSWDKGKGWKDILNNLRLFRISLCYLNLLKPWLFVVFKPHKFACFCRLFFQLNQFINLF